MPTTSGPSSRRRVRVITTLAGGLLAVVGAAAVGVAVTGQEPAPPAPPRAAAQPTTSQPTTSQSPTSTPTSAAPESEAAQEPTREATKEPRQSTEALDYSEPVRLRIPSIDVSSSLVDLGLDDSGAMTTPQDPDKAGWFTPSPAPGVTGASVIAGHVTWNEDRSVFFRLGDLRAGDQVLVERKDGITVVYEVTRTGTFPKNDFPTQAVYQPVDQPELRLITCGGGYDETTNNYLSNVIVWAEMVGSR